MDKDALFKAYPPLHTDGIIDVLANSNILHIILHSLYHSTCAQLNADQAPTLHALVQAIDLMPSYGLTVATVIVPGTPLYSLLQSYSTETPLEVYTLAAHHNMEALAVSSSRHFLLKGSPMDIEDDAAERMGPRYLRRILVLDTQVREALKMLVMLPPKMHTLLDGCSEEQQQEFARRWTVAAGKIAWDAATGVYSCPRKGQTYA